MRDVLSLFVGGRHDLKYTVLNTAKLFDGGVFDFNVGTARNYFNDEYKMNKVLGIKKIVFAEGHPYFVKNTGEKVKVHAIHCLGMAKHYMCGIGNMRLSVMDYAYGIYYHHFRSIKNILHKKNA